MTNPNSEGLPSRIELPGGYWFKCIEDLDRFPKTQSRARWYYELKAPSGRTIHTFGRTDALALTTAINTRTDALGAALEEALRIASDEMDEVFGGDMRARDTAIVAWKRQARAALEAWRKGR